MKSAENNSTRKLPRVCEKAGWLTKNDPAKYFGSTARWFSLNSTSKTLEYALTENGPVKGAIQLSSVVGLGDSKIDDLKMFRIILPNRIYELTAETAVECREWIACLVPYVVTPVMRARSQDRLIHDGHKAIVPWTVDSVWKSEEDFDQELVHSIDLGPPSANRGYMLKIKLSDGTTYEVDTAKANLRDGHPVQLAESGTGSLVAQLVNTPRARRGLQKARKEASTSPDAETPHSSSMSPSQQQRFEALHCALLGAGAAMAVASVLHLSPVSMGIAAVGLMINAMLLLAAIGTEGLSFTALLPWATPEYTLLLTARSNGEESDEPETNEAEVVGPHAPPETAIDFSGKWTLNLDRSGDPSEMLKALGVPWAARKALAHCERKLVIEQDELSWTETISTSVVSKTSHLWLDGRPTTEVSPVDKTLVTTSTFYEDQEGETPGTCLVSKTTWPDGSKSQVIKRRLIENQQVYYVTNTLVLGADRTIQQESYFMRGA